MLQHRQPRVAADSRCSLLAVGAIRRPFLLAATPALLEPATVVLPPPIAKLIPEAVVDREVDPLPSASGLWTDTSVELVGSLTTAVPSAEVPADKNWSGYIDLLVCAVLLGGSEFKYAWQSQAHGRCDILCVHGELTI